MTSNIINIPLADAPITDVTVFSDNACRATRQVTIQPTTTGLQTFTIEGLPNRIYGDSVRVTGTGPCSILEVNTENGTRLRSEFSQSDATKREIEDLMNQLKELHKESEKLKYRQTVSVEKKQAIEGFVRCQLSSAPKGGFSDFKLSDSQSVLQLLDVYAETGAKIDEEMNDMVKALESIQVRQTVINDRLGDLLGQKIHPSQEISENITMWANCIKSYENINISIVKILIDVKKLESIKLNIAYEVFGCGWTPSYEIRVNLTNNLVALAYHAHISQSTQEDWTDVNLAVSTAQIERTKAIPKLPTEIVRFYEPPPPPPPAPVPMMAMNYCARGAVMDMASVALESNALLGAPPMARMGKAKVSTSGITTSYHIEKRTTIESDNKAHKVGIAELQFSSQLMRYAVPSLSKSVYLQAHGTNESEYQLVSSSDVSIFIDGAFVGKTTLSNPLAPGERFHFSLGVDPNISLTHTPARTYGKESGYVSKSRHRTYDVITHLKSAGSSPIHMVVVSQYPTSSDGRITVKLIEPSSPSQIDDENDSLGAITALEKSEGSESFFLNKTTNHLLHVVQLNPGATQTSRVRFEVEWPADQEISFH